VRMVCNKQRGRPPLSATCPLTVLLVDDHRWHFVCGIRGKVGRGERRGVGVLRGFCSPNHPSLSLSGLSLLPKNTQHAPSSG